jgi:hypothetical protein
VVLQARGLHLDHRADASYLDAAGAQCENGMLMIERPRSRTLRRPDRLGEDRREPPFNLFYADMEMDAERRAGLLAQALEFERTFAPELPEAEPVEVDRVVPIDPQ